MNTIDLRSDTVTWPTPLMREAMAKAAVGDDVYGEDPTVNQLQAEAAELLGKEAALFVSSGTQGNLISIMAHCDVRGSEMISGDTSHTFLYEVGGVAAVGGIHPRTVPINCDGTMDIDRIEAAIRGKNDHFPVTRLISIENTHNDAGGVAVSKQYTDQVAELAHRYNLKLHIDGARIFNAATALGISAKELVEHADSVTFCLSKGLCAPAGSIIVGSREFIEKAHSARKMLGGGMRQAGILAAAGLIAIREMIHRLDEDHRNARLLADQIDNINGVVLDKVNTNFVYFHLDENAPISQAEFMERLKNEYNIILSPYQATTGRFRVRTHYWITSERVMLVTRAIKELLN